MDINNYFPDSIVNDPIKESSLGFCMSPNEALAFNAVKLVHCYF